MQPDELILLILEARSRLVDNGHYGPYHVEVSSDHRALLDSDYHEAGWIGLTLRQRILQLDRVLSVTTLYYMEPDVRVIDVPSKAEYNNSRPGRGQTLLVSWL